MKDKEYITINKKEINLDVNMKDLSCLTAYTGLEYSLFSRNDKLILIKGTKTGMNLNSSLSFEILNKRYKWEGHTHPGFTKNCLIPSSSDYNVLKFLNQKKSIIYNSVGDYFIFELEV